MEIPAAPNPPPDDPAARFRKSAEPAAPKPQEPARPPRPQTFGRLLEDTLVAPFRLGSLFDEVAQEPVPGFGLMIANFAVYWTAMIGLNLVYVAIARPAMLRLPPEYLAAVGGAALALVLLGGFGLAAVVEAAALASGGSSDYARSFQLTTLLSAIAPLQAAANWLPSAWPVPLLLGAIACAIGLERLRKAPPIGARVVVLLFAGASLGLLWVARRAAERALAPLAQVEESVEQLQTMTAQLQQAQAPALNTGAGATAPAPAGAQASSLDLLRSGALAGGTPSAQQLQQAQNAAASMIGSVAPMLNDPALLSKMPPQQADALKQITGLIAQTQGTLASGKPLDPRAQQQQMMQMLAALGQLQKNIPKPTNMTPQQQQQYEQMQKMLQQLGQMQVPQQPAPQSQAAPQP